MGVNFKDKNGNIIAKPITVLASDEQITQVINDKIEDGTIDNIKVPDGTVINRTASSVSVEDASEYFESDKVEGVLQEIGAKVKNIVDNGIYNQEPMYNDIPLLFINGGIPEDNQVLSVDVEYISNTNHFKCYGDISLANDGIEYSYNINLYEDSAKTKPFNKSFKSWGEHSSFNLTCNYLDYTQSRDISCSKLWSEIVQSRSDYDTLPEKLKASPNNGAIDGYPVKVYFDYEYYDIYTLNIPLKDWAYNMDKTSTNECILFAKDYNSGCFLKTANIDGTDWVDKLHGSVPANIKTSFNNAINHVLNSSNNDFKSKLSTYFDVNGLIDYYIFQYIICGVDNMGKNQVFITYDGTKWFVEPYNMIRTFGLSAEGNSLVDSDIEMQTDYESGKNTTENIGNRLFKRLTDFYADEIKLRYAELSRDILSYPNILKHFEHFISPIHEYLCDNAEEEIGSFDLIGNSANNINQIREFTRERLLFVRDKINELVNLISCTAISLNKTALDLVDGKEVTKEVHEELDVSFHKGFINRSTDDANMNNADLGTIVSTKTDIVTEFIPVVPEDIFDIVQSSNGNGCGVVGYNSNKEYMATYTNIYKWDSAPSSEVVNITDTEFTVENMPDGISYIRLCFGTTDMSTITITGHNTSTYITEPVEQLIATVTPSNTTEKIKWSTNNSTICKVSDGLVTGINNGKCVVTAKCGEQSATCAVTVSEIKTGVVYAITKNLTNCTISNSSNKVVHGDEYTATIIPSSGYVLSSVSVTMNGADISSTAYRDGTVYIGNVTGDIAIVGTAVEQTITVDPDPTDPDVEFSITSLTDGTFSTAQTAKLVYTTTKAVAKHEFSSNAYNGTHYYTDAQWAHDNGDGVTVSTVEGQGSKYTLSFNPGVLSVGTKNGSLRLTDDDGNVITSNYTLTITEQDTATLSIDSINGGTFAVTDNATVTYTTNTPVVKHEFNLHTESGENFTDGTSKVTSNGNNHTMTFNAGDITEGTKYGAIRVTDASGNTVTKTFTLVITSSSDNITTLAITSITGGTYTTSQQAKITYTTNMAITKHEFNLHNDTTPDAFSDGASRVTSSGNTHTMTFNAGELTAGTKSACIRVTSLDGSVAKATVTLTITGTTSNDYVVCSCKGTKYSTIANAVRNGATTVALVKSRTGAGTGCGRCVGTIQNIIDEITKESGGGTPTTPTLSVTSISGGTFKTTQQAKIVYTTNKAVTKHEFNNHYTSGTTTGFSDGTSRVTSSGTTYTMTFNAGELSAGTKNGAIRLTDANGNTVVKTYTLIINTDSTTTTPPSTPDTPSTPSTPTDTSSAALKDWDAFNNTYGNYVCYSPTQVAVSGKRIRMTAIKKTTTAVPKGGTGTTTTKNYLSGAMVSKKAFKYGTFTFKFKLSANNTYLWPMIWTLPDNTTVKGPELDLLESWGSFTGNSIIQTLHVYQNGTFKSNAKQANTPVDLTKEHTLKLVWSSNNTITMYVDGVSKLTYGPSYMTNPNTGDIDYQVWFLNLGLGTYAGGAPNGVGWFEVTDYSFTPTYTRTRQKQHYWSGNFTDGTLPSGKF